MSDNSTPNESTEQQPVEVDTPKKKNPFGIIVLVVLIIAAGIWGVKFFNYSSNHAETDDAYVEGDLINVSPVVSGTLVHLDVDEGDVVKKGQVVAHLDDKAPKAQYEQALAQYNAAESQIPQAQTNMTYTADSINQQIKQAQDAFEAQGSKLGQEKRRTEFTKETSQAQLAQAKSQELVAGKQVAAFRAQLAAAKVGVATARAGASAVEQSVKVAAASAEKAHKDLARYTKLYGSNGSVGAITAQQYDAAIAADKAATAQYDQAQEQLKQAQSSITQAEAQVESAKAAVETATSQVESAKSAVQIASAGLLQVPVQVSGVSSSRFTLAQNSAAVDAARVGLEQVKLRQQQIGIFVAQAAAAKQAAAAAKVLLDDTIIYAPSDGVVVKKGANVGDALSPGQTIFTMTRGATVWVKANFKETQLEHMRVGQSVELRIDAYPGIVYQGKVLSINEASGNATALLPADNATGNFTKVVQRIPVKIQVDAAPNGNSDHFATAEDVSRLRQGMSVIAAVDTTKH